MQTFSWFPFNFATFLSGKDLLCARFNDIASFQSSHPSAHYYKLSLALPDFSPDFHIIPVIKLLFSFCWFSMLFQFISNAIVLPLVCFFAPWWSIKIKWKKRQLFNFFSNFGDWRWLLVGFFGFSPGFCKWCIWLWDRNWHLILCSLRFSLNIFLLYNKQVDAWYSVDFPTILFN